MEDAGALMLSGASPSLLCAKQGTTGYDSLTAETEILGRNHGDVMVTRVQGAG